MRVFLSIFSVTKDFAKARDIELKQNQFVQGLKTNGIDCFDGGTFTDYPNIFHEIENSSVLVAFIDEYWLSSSWKAIELRYAAGESPEKEHEYIDNPLDCYLHCPNVANVNVDRLLRRENVHKFDGSLSNFRSLVSRGGSR